MTAYRLFKRLEDTIIISTSTITLQNVLKEKYIDAVSKALIKYSVIDKPLKTAVCKGKSHYICDVKLNTYLSSIIRSNSENELIEILQKLCNVSASYIDLDNYSLTPYIKKRICVNKCSKVCGLYNKCRYCKFINKYRNGEYDFIIVNHNYLLTDLLKDNSKLPQYNIVVLDDIYNLYGAAWHTYKTEVSLMQIIKWIDGVKKSKVFRLEGICDEVSRCFEKLFNRLKEGVFEDDRMYIYYIGKLVELLSEMRNLNDDFLVKKQCDELKQKLECIANNESYMIKTNYSDRNIAISAIPKLLNWELYKNLWSKRNKFIIAAGGNENNLKTKIGIDIISEYDIAEAM